MTTEKLIDKILQEIERLKIDNKHLRSVGLYTKANDRDAHIAFLYEVLSALFAITESKQLCYEYR